MPNDISRVDGTHGPVPPRVILAGPMPRGTLSERTTQEYSKDRKDFARFLGLVDGDAAVATLIRQPAAEANALVTSYIESMQRSGLGEATVARRVTSLKWAVGRAYAAGEVSWKLEVSAPRPRRQRGGHRYGPVHLARMQEELGRRQDTKGVRDRCLLGMLWGLHFHRSTLVAIDLEDVDLDDGWVNVRGWGRTEKRWQALTADVRTAVGAWLAVRGGWQIAEGSDPEPLFCSLHLGRPGKRLTADAVHDIVRRLGLQAGDGSNLPMHSVSA